jgi:crossover junction endodeoxyribonuclease RuvC
MMTDRLLALDASSTAIGYCLLVDGRLVASGTVLLPKRVAIGARCAAAQAAFDRLWQQHGPTRIAIEGPAFHVQPMALIAQQRVAGVLLLAAWKHGLSVAEVAPSAAKKALTGKGNADKGMMRGAAAIWGVIGDEHAADALGVALGAREVLA